MKLSELHKLVAAVCPIEGINSEGAIVFSAEATEGEQAAAAAVVTANLHRLGQPDVPVAVTMRQARLALLQAGMLATVNGAIAAMPGAAGDAARIEWEFSSEVQRHKPLVLALAPLLGLDDAQLDALFVQAASL